MPSFGIPKSTHTFPTTRSTKPAPCRQLMLASAARGTLQRAGVYQHAAGSAVKRKAFGGPRHMLQQPEAGHFSRGSKRSLFKPWRLKQFKTAHPSYWPNWGYSSSRKQEGHMLWEKPGIQEAVGTWFPPSKKRKTGQVLSFNPQVHSLIPY